MPGREEKDWDGVIVWGVRVKFGDMFGLVAVGTPAVEPFLLKLWLLVGGLSYPLLEAALPAATAAKLGLLAEAGEPSLLTSLAPLGLLRNGT